MAEPFVAEIRIFSFNFAPNGWALANGQILPIAQNQALFSLLGTTYGGDGITNFALPNLQGGIPGHSGTNNISGNVFVLGETGGQNTHVLSVGEMPNHTHPVSASSKTADQASPSGTVWAQGNNAYNGLSNISMASSAVGSFGGGQAHDNMPPYLVVNMAIALVGIFPSRN